MRGVPQPAVRKPRPPDRRAYLIALVILLTAAALFAAAPAFAAFTHTTVTDVKQCFVCHGTQFSEWKASSPYPTSDGLVGHNVTLAQTVLNVGHNTDEGFTEACADCHSPFSAQNLDATAASNGEFVAPLDQVGPWSLLEPYKTAVTVASPGTGGLTGFYFPADHPSPTNVAGWEGISCRVCHDTATLVDDGSGNLLPKLRFFDAVTYNYRDVTSPTDLCQQCHQVATDDDRTAPAESVHNGIDCVQCHMTGADGTTIKHDLNAGKAGDPLTSTSCSQCHASPGAPAGHPDVTTLQTSFTDMEKFGADPANLLYNANDRKNIHFITCDACHQPVPSGTFSVVFGKASAVSVQASLANHTADFAPASADSKTNVIVWRRDNVADPSTFAALPQPLTPGIPTTVTGITQNTVLYFTQATAAGGTFPGLGRGVQKTVLVKANITIAVSKARVHPRTVVVISGKVRPNKAAKKVIIQKSRNGRTWTAWKTVTLGALSTYKARWTAPTLKGKYFFRTRYAGDKAIAANFSASKLVVVF